jgi:hypothetical protein
MTNGSSNWSVAFESSFGFIFQYGFGFVILSGGDNAVSPAQ